MVWINLHHKYTWSRENIIN